MKWRQQRRLAFIRLIPGKPEARRQGALKRSQTRKRGFPARVPRNPETASAGDDHLDVIAFLQFQSVDHGLGETDCKAISSLGDWHRHVASVYPNRTSALFSVTETPHAMGRPTASPASGTLALASAFCNSDFGA